MIKKVSLATLSITAVFSFLTLLSPLHTAYADCLSEAPMNLSVSNNNGQARLSWTHPGTSLTKFALVYGPMSNSYKHGITMIPKETRSFDVQHLIPGFTYFYRIWSYCDDNGSATQSNEVSWLTPGGNVGGATTMAPDTTAMKPTTTPAPKK